MTVKTIEIVSLTIPEYQLLDKASQLLADIVTSTNKNMPINQKATEAAEALGEFMDAIDEICGC